MTSGQETERVYSQRKSKVREKTSRKRVKRKRISGEANDVNKQTIYIAPKSTNESRVHEAHTGNLRKND